MPQRTTPKPVDAANRLCVRTAADSMSFLSVGVLPSIDSARAYAPLFADFSGTMLPSDSSGELTTGVRLLTFPVVTVVVA